MLPRAILFDMDGTLTAERLDWDGLRAELGVKPDEPILEAILRMGEWERMRAEAILHEHEHHAASRSELNIGCIDLLTWLDTRGIGRALITRNTRKSVRTVFDRHGLHFDIAITREDGKFKPDPDPLWLACERLGVQPEQTWMVGDWRYDIEAGNAAGIHTVWLSYDRTRNFAAEPCRVVRDLCALADVLKSLAG